MNIVQLYEPTSTDGYTDRGDGRLFKTQGEAEAAGKNKWNAYASRSLTHHALECPDGRYLLLKSATPVSLHKSPQATEDIAAAALKKLTAEERAALGL
jgi:hypothetical protein